MRTIPIHRNVHPRKINPNKIIFRDYLCRPSVGHPRKTMKSQISGFSGLHPAIYFCFIRTQDFPQNLGLQR